MDQVPTVDTYDVPRLTGILHTTYLKHGDMKQLLQHEGRFQTQFAKPQVLIGIDYLLPPLGNASLRELPSGFHILATKRGHALYGQAKVSWESGMYITTPVMSLSVSSLEESWLLQEKP